MSLSKNYFLLWARHGEWVNIPENALQHDDSCVVNFGVKLKILVCAAELGNPSKNS